MPPSDEFTEAVLEVVAAIPAGRVMSYGDIAAVLGSRAARGVGQVMAYAGGEVPWWRVVRASGHPVVSHEARALEHYRAEGTPLLWSRDDTVYRIDLERARYSPTSSGATSRATKRTKPSGSDSSARGSSTTR